MVIWFPAQILSMVDAAIGPIIHQRIPCKENQRIPFLKFPRIWFCSKMSPNLITWRGFVLWNSPGLDFLEFDRLDSITPELDAVENNGWQTSTCMFCTFPMILSQVIMCLAGSCSPRYSQNSFSLAITVIIHLQFSDLCSRNPNHFFLISKVRANTELFWCFWCAHEWHERNGSFLLTKNAPVKGVKSAHVWEWIHIRRWVKRVNKFKGTLKQSQIYKEFREKFVASKGIESNRSNWECMLE